MSYCKWLKHAFQSIETTAIHLRKEQATLEEIQVKSIPLLKTRTWMDDNGYEFEIPINPLVQVDEISEAVLTGESFKDYDIAISNLFENIDKLCVETCKEIQEVLLKQLMSSMFDLWKGGRTRSAVQSYLQQHFGESHKQKKEAEKALLFLCKIYHGARKFIDAAERLRIFKSIQCIPVFYQASSPNNNTRSKTRTPLEVAKFMGLTVQGPDWLKYLNQEGASFANIRKERHKQQNFHAEIQMLYHYDLLSPNERKHTHPYIGCSRRCCLLCYFFILLYGGFSVRGTHETLIHRWEIPKGSPARNARPVAKIQFATEQLLGILGDILRGLFKTLRTSNHRELLAQSSDALSSAQFMLEKESAQLERSHREFQ